MVEEMKEFLSSSLWKVEFMGQVLGGRWLVRLEREKDHQDLTKLLVERFQCVEEADPPVTFPSSKDTEAIQSQEKEKEQEVRAVVGPVIPRGVMPDEGVWAAGVCYAR